MQIAVGVDSGCWGRKMGSGEMLGGNSGCGDLGILGAVLRNAVSGEGVRQGLGSGNSAVGWLCRGLAESVCESRFGGGISMGS